MVKIILFVSLLLLLAGTSGSAQTKGNWLRGSWRGTGHQVDDQSTWRMRLKVSANSAQVSYPSLKCGGEWRLISWTAQRAIFRERIKYGTKNCSVRGSAVVHKLSRQRIKFNYYYPGERRVGAYCILRRMR